MSTKHVYVLAISLLLTALVVIALLAAVYTPANPVSSSDQQTNQQLVDRYVSETIYFQDRRTGICFALRDGNTYKQLTYVPCGMVPAKMLIIANVK